MFFSYSDVLYKTLLLPGDVRHCASKWAIEGLTRSLAQELPTGMAAIPLNPSIIHTDMLFISFGEEAANYTPVSDWVLKAVPLILKLKPKDNGIPKTLS
ncbi:hypothetical protein [Nostoc sp.]|uniref:hypothetical protein n=1 Tax=Nostoc sp. TaxID=1180 RepID=UPI002FFBB36B